MASFVVCVLGLACSVQGAEVRLVGKKHDPYGAPRPAMGQENVPLLTTFYARLAVGDGNSRDEVLPESVSITLQADDGEPFTILEPGQHFAAGYSGRLFPGKTRRERTLEVYVDSQRKLRPKTKYTMRVQARSGQGGVLSAQAGTWQFATEAAPQTHAVHFDLALDVAPVTWTGGFFSGFCKPSFCTSSATRMGSYKLMEQVRRTAPRAWSLQRDFWMTGMDGRPRLLPPRLPGLVRERETRRITAMERQEDKTLLHVEDFFGHQQYGIKSGRRLSEDYRPGYQVLLADGTNDARVSVVAVNDSARTILVTRPETPATWKLEYAAPLPAKEHPDWPGLFPPGGCYLKRFQPTGTPVYYWGRLDHEWDIAFRQFHRRLMPNFADAPGDLAIDGRNWTTAKDYAELHEVVRVITGHIIDRYGDAAVDFPWCVFNEPDLGVLFWRSDWIELQKFYDYTVDGILRAFEDRGYNSTRVMVGGLELGGIFGVNLRLQDFLVHCSPRADPRKAAPVRKGRPPTLVLRNAAFEDNRLDGKRSRRVESLCRDNHGRGSPCDFVSIHAYNTSQLMADKLIRAKEIALNIDHDYYADLWVNSHESCPGWDMPPDPAYADSYLGNGYFPTWCVDVMRRQLQRAAEDARYGFGESILTFWPEPNANFGGGNACTRVIHVDDDADGRPDRSATVAMPILHFLGLTNGMGNQFFVLPERKIGAHVVSGFAGRTGDRIQLVAYSHSQMDTESRSNQTFEVEVNLRGVSDQKLHVTEFRFDKDHNSYFRLARRLREQRIAATLGKTDERVPAAIRKLKSGKKSTVLQALAELSELGPAAKSALVPLYLLARNTKDGDVRDQAKKTATRLTARDAYAPHVLRQVEELSKLRATAKSTLTTDGQGRLKLRLSLSANGANFVVIEPRHVTPRRAKTTSSR